MLGLDDLKWSLPNLTDFCDSMKFLPFKTKAEHQNLKLACINNCCALLFIQRTSEMHFGFCFFLGCCVCVQATEGTQGTLLYTIVPFQNVYTRERKPIYSLFDSSIFLRCHCLFPYLSNIFKFVPF